jgi:hypothetical protein
LSAEALHGLSEGLKEALSVKLALRVLEDCLASSKWKASNRVLKAHTTREPHRVDRQLLVTRVAPEPGAPCRWPECGGMQRYQARQTGRRII